MSRIRVNRHKKTYIKKEKKLFANINLTISKGLKNFKK